MTNDSNSNSGGSPGNNNNDKLKKAVDDLMKTALGDKIKSDSEKENKNESESEKETFETLAISISNEGITITRLSNTSARDIPGGGKPDRVDYYIMQVVGWAYKSSEPCNYVGMFLAEFTPDTNNAGGVVGKKGKFTYDKSQAKRYNTAEELIAEYDTEVPNGPRGKPYRPLHAFAMFAMEVLKNHDHQ